MKSKYSGANMVKVYFSPGYGPKRLFWLSQQLSSKWRFRDPGCFHLVVQPSFTSGFHGCLGCLHCAGGRGKNTGYHVGNIYKCKMYLSTKCSLAVCPGRRGEGLGEQITALCPI